MTLVDPATVQAFQRDGVVLLDPDERKTNER